MRLLSKLTLASLGLALIGCGGSSLNAEAKFGAIRVINACADSPALDLSVNGVAQQGGMTFGSFTFFNPYQEGSQQVQMRQSNGLRVVDDTFNLGALEYKTFILFGSFAKRHVQIITDDRSNAPANKAKLKFLHMSPSNGNLDVYVNQVGVGTASTKPLVANLPFSNVGQYVLIPSGNYHLVLTKAGSKTSIYDSNAVNFASGVGRTIILEDKTGGGASPMNIQIFFDTDN